MIYRSKVVGLGNSVKNFRDTNMLILFNDNAPSELKDYCVIHNSEIQSGQNINVGDRFIINEIEYKITSIGEAASKNLINLGHITLVFDGANEAQMYGNIHVDGDFYLPQIGDYLTVMRG